MDQKLLLEQRAELEQQLKSELKACRATRRKIAAVNMLLGQTGSLINVSQTEPDRKDVAVAFRPTLEAVLKEDREKSIMETIRQTLENARGAFTARTLVETINVTTHCRVTERDVSHPLWKLKEEGVIRLLEKGSGRRPAIYLKA